MERSLQHRPATLITELQSRGACDLAAKQPGVWRRGNHYALPTSPPPDGGDRSSAIAALINLAATKYRADQSEPLQKRFPDDCAE
jgi:hypothetical protein